MVKLRRCYQTWFNSDVDALGVLFCVFTCFTLLHWWRWWFGLLTTLNKKQAAWNDYILMMTVPKKKQNKNKLQDEAKSLPTNSKQTNKYTNRIIHPWTPIISGSLTFPNVFSKKNKKNTFQTFSGCRNQQKEKADGQPLPLPYLKRMVKRRLYLSHPSQNVNPFIGMLGKFLIELTILYFKSSWIGTKKLTHLLRVSASVTSYLEQPSTETKQKQQAAKSNMSPKKQQTGILLLWNGYLRKDNPRITTHLKTKHVSWNLCWLQDALSCWFFFWIFFGGTW